MVAGGCLTLSGGGESGLKIWQECGEVRPHTFLLRNSGMEV